MQKKACIATYVPSRTCSHVFSPSSVWNMLKRIRERFENDRLEYEFLPHALEIEETPPKRTSRILIWIIFSIMVATFLWAYLGRVDEVAVARGKIVPDGRIKIIQPVETGVIRAIHVTEGQRVKEGQLLIELDPTIKQADAESSAKALNIQMANKERLIRELNGGMERPSGNMPADVHPEIAQLQKKFKEAREAEFQAKEDAQRSVIAQREKAIQVARAILTKLEKVCAVTREEEAAYRAVGDKGYIAKLVVLGKQKELFSAEQELEAQKGTLAQTLDSLEEARKTLAALRKERERLILNDILESEKNITSVEGEAIKARKMFELERLCSPVDGTVHGLSLYTIGGVVTSAQPVVTIVPEGTPLIIEASILNKDIGFVKTGQEAEIKMDTFPFQKYGTIVGNVTAVSPDAFDDEKQGPIYKVKVGMNSWTMVVDGKKIPLVPGMTASVEIKTDKRTILEFFMSPLVKYADESLTLR